MTALAADTIRQQLGSGPMPGTLKAKMTAGATFFHGSLICTDTATGYDVVGQASTTLIPRGVYMGPEVTNSGADGAVEVEVIPGIFRFANSGGGDAVAITERGEKCYIADDNTVAKLDGTGTRSEAGTVIDVDSAGVWVCVGPYPVPGSTYVTLTGAQTLTNKTLTTPTIASAANFTWYTNKAGIIEIPLGSITDADGDQVKFANGSTDGLTIADSKAVCYRINNDATPPKNLASFNIPTDANVAENMTLKFMVSKSGATVGDATTITVEAFNQVNGALHDADTNYGGATGALVGDATAKTISVLSRTLAHADLPAVGSKVSLTFKPTDGLLGTDDLLIHRVWVEYTKLTT
jgi:hypothetical protein